MIVYEVIMTNLDKRIRQGWVKTLDEATTYMDTFIAGADKEGSYTVSVLKHKSKTNGTPGILAILNGSTEQTLMYTATVDKGDTRRVYRRNRKILNPTAIAYSNRQTLDTHPSLEHADAVAYVMQYQDLLTLCVKAPNISAWQETTRRIGARQGEMSTRRLRSYVWHWFHVRGNISP